MNILMVLTSHDRLGDTGVPAHRLLAGGAGRPLLPTERRRRAHYPGVTRGGQPPLDPKADPDMMTDDTRRFEADAEAMAALDNTPAAHSNSRSGL
ncbi:hypothetical protein MBH78_20925 [Oceanimonas sp. NS1]|nr:hypothetical protein [Oceanimonas sp. NS1]